MHGAGSFREPTDLELLMGAGHGDKGAPVRGAREQEQLNPIWREPSENPTGCWSTGKNSNAGRAERKTSALYGFHPNYDNFTRGKCLLFDRLTV